jgi:copper chaperone CopZ
LVSCRQQDVRTVTVHVPGLKDDASAEKVRKALAATEGVVADKVRVDVGARKAVVTYDSMKVAIKNIEFAVADAGFSAKAEQSEKPVPAKPRASEKRSLSPRGRDADTAAAGPETRPTASK